MREESCFCSFSLCISALNRNFAADIYPYIPNSSLERIKGSLLEILTIWDKTQG